jgi:DHA2 family multidrug resistance protein
LTGVPSEKSNNASAIINMMRNIGSSVGISLVTTLIARREQYHQNVLVEHVTPFSRQYHGLIQQLQQAYLAQTASAADALRQAQAQVYTMVQREAALLSFNDSFWAMAVLLVAMVPLVFLLRKPQPGAAQPQGH